MYFFYQVMRTFSFDCDLCFFVLSFNGTISLKWFTFFETDSLLENETNGYIFIHAEGGLNQQRIAVSFFHFRSYYRNKFGELCVRRLFNDGIHLHTWWTIYWILEIVVHFIPEIKAFCCHYVYSIWSEILTHCTIDVQCSCWGKNHECNSYFAGSETRPDLERPNQT